MPKSLMRPTEESRVSPSMIPRTSISLQSSQQSVVEHSSDTQGTKPHPATKTEHTAVHRASNPKERRWANGSFITKGIVAEEPNPNCTSLVPSLCVHHPNDVSCASLPRLGGPR